MWHITIVLLVAALGCSRPTSDDASNAHNRQGKKAISEKTIRILVHRNPFNFDGVDRISFLGSALNEVETPIPFAETEIDEIHVPYEQSKHELDTGEVPDFIHRFKRPDGYFVDFLIKDNRIETLIESTRPYGWP